MGWTERITESLRGLGSSSIARELIESAKAKAEKGLEAFLHGKPAEGERLVEEAKQEATEAGVEARKEEIEARTEGAERPDEPSTRGTSGMH